MSFIDDILEPAAAGGGGSGNLPTLSQPNLLWAAMNGMDQELLEQIQQGESSSSQIQGEGGERNEEGGSAAGGEKEAEGGATSFPNIDSLNGSSSTSSSSSSSSSKKKWDLKKVSGREKEIEVLVNEVRDQQNRLVEEIEKYKQILESNSNSMMASGTDSRERRGFYGLARGERELLKLQVHSIRNKKNGY